MSCAALIVTNLAYRYLKMDDLDDWIDQQQQDWWVQQDQDNEWINQQTEDDDGLQND